MSNIVAYKPKTQVSTELMQTVREALYDYGDVELLHIKTGLSEACLYAIRSGRTKWPRITTLELLFAPLNLRITIERMGPVDKQVSTAHLKQV